MTTFNFDLLNRNERIIYMLFKFVKYNISWFFYHQYFYLFHQICSILWAVGIPLVNTVFQVISPQYLREPCSCLGVITIYVHHGHPCFSPLTFVIFHIYMRSSECEIFVTLSYLFITILYYDNILGLNIWKKFNNFLVKYFMYWILMW